MNYIAIKVGAFCSGWVLGNISKSVMRVACVGMPALLSVALPQTLKAQEFTLETGASALETISVDLPPGSSVPGSRLTFDFGFSTSETIQPGVFPDAVSFTLNSDNLVAFIATTDVNGTSWAPATPGGLSLDPSSFTFSEIAYPDPSYPTSFAYSFSMEIPSEFHGGMLNLDFSLFNNQDGVGSEAFLRNVVVVPEPTTISLMGISLFMGLFLVRRVSRN